MPEETPEEDAVYILPVDPTSTGSSVEEDSVTSEPGADEEGEVQVELPKFDERYRETFEGLAFIGKVTRSFRWLGHRFVIKTPNVDDLLEIGQLHKPYANTVADIKAYQALMIAAVVQSVDGQSLPIPIGENESGLEAKFEYVRHTWYPWTLDKLYNEYLVLDSEVAAVHDALGKA
jgi:hypothetical protein